MTNEDNVDNTSKLKPSVDTRVTAKSFKVAKQVLCSYMYDTDMSCIMRKPTFYICENNAADQLRGNREGDQRLCFRYIDSTIPLLSKSEI